MKKNEKLVHISTNKDLHFYLSPHVLFSDSLFPTAVLHFMMIFLFTKYTKINENRFALQTFKRLINVKRGIFELQ